MKTSHIFGIQFITRTTKHEKDIGKVYARITVDKARVEISLKLTNYSILTMVIEPEQPKFPASITGIGIINPVRQIKYEL